MIRTIIADDEPLARRHVQNSLADFNNIEVVAQCENGVEAVEAIINQKPDLLFLDIQMPAMDGLGVLDSSDIEVMPFVIFVTAYDQYAVQAFERHAFDYLLKPYSAERFREAMNRIIGFIEQRQQSHSSESFIEMIREFQTPTTYNKRVAVRSTSSIYFVNVDEIEWIESAGNYVDIHTRDKAHLLRETMSNMADKLDPEQFLRIHRSAIVNIDQIEEIKPEGYNYLVRLKNGKTLNMARKYKDELQDLIQKLF